MGSGRSGWLAGEGTTDPRKAQFRVSLVSFAFVFNLLVGAGALAIPKPFAAAGFIVAAPFLAVLCFFSFLTSLFMVEVLIAVKLISKGEKDEDMYTTKSLLESKELPETVSDSHTALAEPLLGNAGGAGGSGIMVHDLGANSSSASSSPDANSAQKKLEMGALSKKLFSPLGSKLTYVVLSLYLFGDLSIYSVTIPKSLTALVCPHQKGRLGFVENWSCTNFENLPKSNPLHGLDSQTVYRSFVVLLGLVQLPFMFQNVQKTLFIQVLSITYRWSAFLIIIMICLVQMFSEKKDRNWDDFTRQHDFKGLLPLFGVTIYSFMCHHSLPSLLNPIMSSMPSEQLNLKRIATPVAWALACCLLVYLVLDSVVALRWRPDAIEDVITLNFQNFRAHEVSVFLELFPVCTLGASFPIIACTLRNNLQTLIMLQQQRPGQGHSAADAQRSSWLKFVERVVLPLVVLILPLLVAFVTQNVEMLVSITGSYGGCCIEFIIPTLLVMSARKKVNSFAQANLLRSKLSMGKLSSPFFVYLILSWSAVCLILVTLNQF